MRLYLSSYRLGDHPERLTAMLPDQARVAVIGNALDAVPAIRPAAVAQEIDALSGLGLRPDELDLRTDDPRELTSYDGVWIRGGNVFVLRDALRRSGADDLVTDLIRSGEIVYAGYSAGACVLAPSLRGLDLCDDPGDAGEVIWDGLGVLAHAIVPHLDSPGHPETELVARVAARYDADGTPYTGLSDGRPSSSTAPPERWSKAPLKGSGSSEGFRSPAIAFRGQRASLEHRPVTRCGVAMAGPGRFPTGRTVGARWQGLKT